MSEVSQDVVDGFLNNLFVPRKLSDLICVQVNTHKKRLVVEHLFKVRYKPLAVDGVASETAAEVIVDSARCHGVERCCRYVQSRRVCVCGIATQQQVDIHSGREFGRRTKTAPFTVEATNEMCNCTSDGAQIGNCVGRLSELASLKRLHQCFNVGVNVFSAIFPNIGNSRHQLQK